MFNVVFQSATFAETRTHTGGLISCEDAFAWSYYPVSNVLQLLLLLRGQCWILVSHGG